MTRRAGYQDRRARIVDAALRILAADGFAALTVDRAIAEAGISKGTFYHYFPAKEELVEAALLRSAERIADGFAASARATDDPVGRLAALLSLVRPWTGGEEPADGRALAAVLLATPELAGLRTRMFTALADRLAPEVATVLSDGARTGEFQVDDPATTAALLVMLALSTRARVAELALAEAGSSGGAAPRAGSARDAERWIAGFLAIVERALALPPASLPRRVPSEGGRT